MHLALYCFANGQLSTALKLLYRARYLLLLVSGEDHPEMALLDVSAVFTWFFGKSIWPQKQMLYSGLDAL